MVKANGSVMTKQGANAWFGKRVGITQIEAGDVIVVPVDIKQTRFLENLTHGTQIIYQLAVAAAAVNSSRVGVIGHLVILFKNLNKGLFSDNLSDCE